MNKYIFFAAVALVALASVAAASDCSCSGDCMGVPGNSSSVTYDFSIAVPCSNCSITICNTNSKVINYCTSYSGTPDTSLAYCPKALGLALKWIVTIAIVCVVVLFLLPIAVCFCCGMACFAGRRNKSVTYVNVPAGQGYGSAYA